MPVAATINSNKSRVNLAVTESSLGPNLDSRAAALISARSGRVADSVEFADSSARVPHLQIDLRGEPGPDTCSISTGRERTNCNRAASDTGRVRDYPRETSACGFAPSSAPDDRLELRRHSGGFRSACRVTGDASHPR